MLGLADSRKLKYIGNVSKLEFLVDKEKERFINKNIDVFTGMGSFPDLVAIKLSKEAIPKVCPTRRVPYAIKDKLRETLNE